MKKRYAIITDIHGNIEGLTAILDDISKKNIDEILCLGDIIGIGPDSKECIDKMIELNIKSILGNHELYVLRGTGIDKSIENEEKKHHEWIKNSLTKKELDYINSCSLYYELDIKDNNLKNKKIILSHYLIKDKTLKQPFEEGHLKKNINLWIDYNDKNTTYVIGHLHRLFDINEVEGIKNNIIEKINESPNIELVGSGGCSYDEYVSYMIIEIDKTIKYEHVKVKFDRKSFITKIKELDFPDKKNIMKYFYGIEI